MKQFFITFLVLASLSACQKGNEEKKADTSTSEAIKATPQVDSLAKSAPTPAPTTYVAVVNDLRLREIPTLDGKVLATLKQGDKMTGTGNVSKEKVTVDLRGQKLTDVFYEVTAANGTKGWAFAGAVAAEGSNAADANKDTWLFTKDKVGGITNKTDEAGLIALFGKNNITQEKELYANADVPPFQGVTIFKGKPDALEVFWEEGKKGKKIAFVVAYNKKGQWRTPEGIKVGTTLAELVKLNGKPLEFSGFGWDYGGYINNWNKGKLEKSGVSLQLNYNQDIMPTDFLGDVTCKSDNPKLAKLANQIYVSKLTSTLGE